MNNHEKFYDLLNTMSFDEIDEVLSNASDNIIWRPFYNDTTIKKQYNDLIDKIFESKEWPSIRNKEKGTLLENLTQLLFERFTNHNTCQNSRTSDNEIDVIVKFNEILSPPFIKNLKLNFICECKNKANASIDVGMVSKLVELCEYNNAGMGIFFSHKGVSGNGWKYGQGKIRKLFLKTNVPIISFKISELENFSVEGYNFYSEIKRKHQALIDEIDYEGAALKNYQKDNPEFFKFLLDTVKELHKLEIISMDDLKKIENTIIEKYKFE